MHLGTHGDGVGHSHLSDLVVRKDPEVQQQGAKRWHDINRRLTLGLRWLAEKTFERGELTQEQKQMFMMSGTAATVCKVPLPPLKPCPHQPFSSTGTAVFMGVFCLF